MSYNLTGATSGGTFVLTRAGGATANLVTGGAATTVTPQNTTFALAGKLYYAASGTIGTATPTTDYNTGLAFKPLLPSKGCVYVWGLTSAGALKLVQGPFVDLDSAGAWVSPPQFPPIPDDICPISYSLVRAGSTASASGWLIGTNNFTGVTGITVTTAVDLFAMPSVPQTS